MSPAHSKGEGAAVHVAEVETCMPASPLAVQGDDRTGVTERSSALRSSV